MKHEAFVYQWQNSMTHELYVGFHIGSHEDGYKTSSKNLLPLLEAEPHCWFRTVLAFGTAAEMQAFETGYLRGIDARRNPKYINQWNNEALYTFGNDAKEHNREAVEGILYKAGTEKARVKGVPDMFVIYVDDKFISCDPKWISESQLKAIGKMLGTKVICTVTKKGKYYYFSPVTLKQLENQT